MVMNWSDGEGFGEVRLLVLWYRTNKNTYTSGLSEGIVIYDAAILY